MPILGLFGILMAFGHSVLAMSGEESLAQVNREIEHPKLKNLKRAAIVIAIYSLIFTGGATLLASMLIPGWDRTHIYQDNLIAGLAMYMVGPLFWRIAFRIFVVLVGFLILSGAINTSMIGSTGVLMRVAEDGVSDRLVPQAASPVRHQLSHRQPGLHPADVHDHRHPGQHHHAGRGLRLRRHLVIHLQQPGHAGAALEVPWRARLEGSAEYSHRQDRDSDRPAFGLHGAADARPS